jgi:hypothetical protein
MATLAAYSIPGESGIGFVIGMKFQPGVNALFNVAALFGTSVGVAAVAS